MGRAEFSNRQDWSVEASAAIYPLMQPLLSYVIYTLRQDPNILRDSILMRLEIVHFQAYLHVCAVMWRTVYRELRALTNDNGLELNPLELNCQNSTFCLYSQTLNLQFYGS